MRLINIDTVRRIIDSPRNKTQMLNVLEQTPTVEIIKCKDCKYCDKGIDEDGKPFLKCLGWVYGGTSETDFCSHAERREDD